MKKNTMTLIGVVVLVVVAIGGYALFHASTKPTTAATTTSTYGTSGQNQSISASSAVLTTKTSSAVGQYLVDSSGNALYVYSGDSSGVSNCTSSCLANWPAYQDKGATTGLPANVGTIKRSDNNDVQYTYKGMPLYTFVGDSQGQVTGNGVSNFNVAKP
jgi:predicted lipoprotein with Yx(FWY)xxD motif